MTRTVKRLANLAKAVVLTSLVGCGLIVLAAIGFVDTEPVSDLAEVAGCQSKADVFRKHVASADFTVEQADRLAIELSLCDATVDAKIEEAAAPEPNLDSYEGRLAMLVAHRHERLAAEQRKEEAERWATEAHRQEVASAQASPECAKARSEYEAFRPADTYARDFYERNVLPVACSAGVAEDPTERMRTPEERTAAQVELLQATAKLFVKLEGVSKACANLHANLALERFKAERGWIPLLTDDRMTAYYSASTGICPSEHVILD